MGFNGRVLFHRHCCWNHLQNYKKLKYVDRYIDTGRPRLFSALLQIY